LSGFDRLRQIKAFAPRASIVVSLAGMPMMRATGLVTGGLLTAALVAAGVVTLAYRHDIALAYDVAQRGSLLLETVAGSIEYGEQGSGMPLLSIHGAGGGFDQGLANAAELVGSGFRIIAPSRFGYLRTAVPQDGSPAAQADAHAALLSRLGIKEAVVVGVSAGARSAVELALRRPDMVSGLVLIVPGLYSPDSPVSIQPSRGNRFAFWAVNAGGDFAWWVAEKLAPSLLVRFLGIPPHVAASASQAEQGRVMTIVRSVEPLSLRFRGINIDSKPDLHELPLERIAVPTLIISARDDLFNTLPAAEHAAGKIPGSRLVVYDTGGHLLVGRTDDVRAKIRSFLNAAGLFHQPGVVAMP
jgi:2-hydroxy-6-oxonona-2,4-dienedioate hydrolase